MSDPEKGLVMDKGGEYSERVSHTAVFGPLPVCDPFFLRRHVE